MGVENSLYFILLFFVYDDRWRFWVFPVRDDLGGLGWTKSIYVEDRVSRLVSLRR